MISTAFLSPLLLPPSPSSSVPALSRRDVPRASTTNFPFRGNPRNPSNLPNPFISESTPFISFPTPPTSPPIRLLASDLDGTLLTASKNIHPANIPAVLTAIDRGLLFIPATGKSRVGAIRAMGPLGAHLQSAHAGKFPGIFLNGLLVYGTGGALIFEQKLETEQALYIMREAEARGLTVLFYAGDNVLVRERTEQTDMFIVSHEPVPTAVGNLSKAVRETAVHKALLLDPSGEVAQHRAGLEHAFNGVADITQARPDVLEVLPMGASKGAAFLRLLDDLGVAKGETMAIGDGENDIEMIKVAGLGVAVANAVPEMLSVADEVVCANDDAAVEEAIRRFVIVNEN